MSVINTLDEALKILILLLLLFFFSLFFYSNLLYVVNSDWFCVGEHRHMRIKQTINNLRINWTQIYTYVFLNTYRHINTSLKRQWNLNRKSLAVREFRCATCKKRPAYKQQCVRNEWINEPSGTDTQQNTHTHTLCLCGRRRS